ncbi:MAG: hypothetical protein R3F60_28820 [bacterium]
MRAMLSLTALLVPCAALALSKPLQVVPVGGSGPSWAPTQAVGAPDCQGAGDQAQAWATLRPDEGLQWLELDYAQAVPVASVRVFENFNPGAIVKIEAVVDGEAVEIWSGSAPRGSAPQVFEAPASKKVTASRLRITLDTSRVSGWNEIDAVELVGQDGSRQWASDARASSTYASATGAVGPLDGLVGKRVKLRVGGEVLRGTLKSASGPFFSLESASGEVLVNAARLDWIALD